ncbi:MAG: spore coat U domain-containing protein [Bryobacteraceae bacterium]
MKKLNFALLCVLMFGLVNAGLADTDSDTFQVTANVAAGCTVSSEDLNFGAYGGLATSDAVDASATVTYACTMGTNGVIRMDQGLYQGGGSTDASPLRQMAGSTTGYYLRYDLYSDASRTTVWGNTTATGVAVTGDGTEITSQKVYGRIVAGQAMPIGSYVDTVTVSIDF